MTASIDSKDMVIIIKDDGVGMDRKTLENLFMPFYTTKNEGTGLGMPISRKIIATHSGTLEINSRLGVGTVATVRLPYKADGRYHV